MGNGNLRNEILAVSATASPMIQHLSCLENHREQMLCHECLMPSYVIREKFTFHDGFSSWI